MTATPRASGSASGGSMTILAGGSLAVGGMAAAGPQVSLAVWAVAVNVHRATAAPVRPMKACLMTVLRDGGIPRTTGIAFPGQRIWALLSCGLHRLSIRPHGFRKKAHTSLVARMK